jgi:26S proteasome regulatory subunit T4
MVEARRQEALQKFQKKLREHRDLEASLKSIREKTHDLEKEYNKSEDDLKALQSVGQVMTSMRRNLFFQIIGEVLRQLSDEKFIVKASSGPRYIVGCRRGIDRAKLKPSTRVSLDMTTLTIMRTLPREVKFCSHYLFLS